MQNRFERRRFQKGLSSIESSMESVKDYYDALHDAVYSASRDAEEAYRTADEVVDEIDMLIEDARKFNSDMVSVLESLRDKAGDFRDNAEYMMQNVPVDTVNHISDYLHDAGRELNRMQ